MRPLHSQSCHSLGEQGPHGWESGLVRAFSLLHRADLNHANWDFFLPKKFQVSKINANGTIIRLDSIWFSCRSLFSAVSWWQKQQASCFPSDAPLRVSCSPRAWQEEFSYLTAVAGPSASQHSRASAWGLLLHITISSGNLYLIPEYFVRPVLFHLYCSPRFYGRYYPILLFCTDNEK